jgi:hypothetical protein
MCPSAYRCHHACHRNTLKGKATPLDYAVSNGHQECVDILAAYGGVDYKTMELYAASLIQKVFRQWSKQKADKDQQTLSLKREAAATILQAGFRGTISRKQVRCAFSDIILYSRMPLDPMHVRLKRTCVVTNGIPRESQQLLSLSS